MMLKKIAAALTSAAVMLCMSSCTDEPVVREQTKQTTITLSWWGNDSRNEYTLKAVERFEQLHPNIKVKCNYSEWSGYEARSRVQMISGTEADVMQINVGWLSQYSADGNGYYDLESLGDTVDLSNFTDEMLDYGRRNGVLNAIPIAMNAETLYINKTIYDKYGLDIPTTWEDLFDAAKVLSKDGIYPISGSDKSMWLYCITYAEQQSGRKIFDSENRFSFTVGDMQTMIDFYCRLVNEKAMPKIEDFQRFNIDNGNYAGLVAWVSDALNYFKEPIAAGNEIVAVPYTANSPERSGEGWYAKPATLYAISKNTEHPKEAAELLDFMLNSHEWAELQGVEKGIPISASARRYLDDIGQLNGLQYEASLVMETNELISPMNSLVENSDLYNEFISACDLVLFNKATSAEAAEQLYKTYSQTYTMAQ